VAPLLKKISIYSVISLSLLWTKKTHTGVAPLLYALPTASTVVSRPPATPDPVTALQPTSATSKDATLFNHLPSPCHDSPPYEDLSNEDLMSAPTT